MQARIRTTKIRSRTALRHLLTLAPAALLFTTVALAAEPLGSALPNQAVDDLALADARGGTETVSEMKLNGVVGNNEAYNLSTGNNTISDGTLEGASGIPMLIQNSGNNVLIQNATIVNVQVQ